VLETVKGTQHLLKEIVRKNERERRAWQQKEIPPHSVPQQERSVEAYNGQSEHECPAELQENQQAEKLKAQEGYQAEREN